MPWYSLSDEEAARLNPPEDAPRRDEWLPVGWIPCPKTRLGWLLYHLVHGLWMRYPLHKVVGYALANTRPGWEDAAVVAPSPSLIPAVYISSSDLAPLVNVAERGKSLHIDAGERQHVYPLAYFYSLIAGEPVEPMSDDVLRVVVAEWLAGVELNYGESSS